ncbi:hypothetical protein V8G54_014860 [Vigna mungo]|uniref:Protein kinase domain-containing protein n=1 Tax=Vigna mungo TaxID=3915 RepID=A0AAQ3NJY3_VIGMU
MAISALFLVVLLQLSTIFGSEVVLQSKECGTDWVAHSYSSHGPELFYINGNVVDKVAFCEALQSYTEKGCDVNDYFGSVKCVTDVSFVDFPLKAGRKLLKKDSNTESKPQGDSKPNPAHVVGISAGGALFACCLVLCPCFFKRRKATSHAVLSKDPNSMDSVSSFEASVNDKIPASPLRVPASPSRFSMYPKLSRLQSLHLDLNQVTRATNNFSETLQIGEGGFGTVYKAKLEDGLVVAVKRAKKEHFDSLRAEFSSEVQLLAKIDHRNLVKLLGYIDKGNERLLITEFVPNGTLREHLDGMRGKTLDFNQRLEIAIDVAHGLTYLHLYAEIVSGRRPVELKKTVEERVTLRWAFKKYNEGSVVELVDPLMEEAVNTDVLMKMFDLAFQCAAPIRADRPDMKSVSEQLWAIRADYLKSARRT